MENTRKKILQEEIRVRQKELDEINAQERDELKAKIKKEHARLLEELRKMDEKFEEYAREEEKKRKALCKKYGHYSRVTDRKFLHSSGLRTQKFGEIWVTKITSTCACCGKVSVRTVTISNAFSHNIEFEAKKRKALEALEKEIEAKQEKLSKKEEAVFDRLTDLLEEYLLEVVHCEKPNISDEALEKLCEEWFNYD